MPVDSLLTQLFLSKEAILLILGVYLFTYIVRTVIEGMWKVVSESRLYTKVILPLGPIFNGMILAFASDSLLWPAGIKSFFWGRVFYGGGCGLVAGWAYTRIRDWAKGTGEAARPLAASERVVDLSVPVSPPSTPVAMDGSVDVPDSRPTVDLLEKP